MTKRKIYWLCQMVGWGSYGILQIFLYTIAERFDPGQISGVFFQVVFYILLTHFFRHLIICFGWLNLRLPRLLPKLILSTLILSLLNYAYLLSVSFFKGEIDSGDLMGFTITINMLGYWLIYFIWTIFYFVVHYVERYNNSLKVEATSREVELKNLKAQLNPHFIFNALNSIRALVDENPRKSKESITQLSHILRNSLTSDRKKLISFSEELKTVMDYLALESIRYEERLVTFFHVDLESGKFLIPPLMLQTLIENSIKHGISNLKEGGIIDFTTKVKREHLVLEIRNTGQLNGNLKELGGVGLKNTMKRLELIFGEEAALDIKNEDSTTVLTTIHLPAPNGVAISKSQTGKVK